MSLLADLYDGSLLDHGYADAASRRGSPARSPAGVVAVLAVVGLLAVVAVQQVRRSKPAAVRQHDRLVSAIKDRTAETDTLEKQLGTLRGETERARTAALTRSAEGRQAQTDLVHASDAAAARPVRGPALVVTLNDAETDPTHGQGRVFDQDLQIVVNGLWAAGATAIAINGQRLTATTAIRTAGQAVLVDYRPLTPPYAVTALGDPVAVLKGFAAGTAATRLRELHSAYGIRFDIDRRNSMTLPASVPGQLRYAREESPR